METRWTRIKRVYGLTKQDYYTILSAQDNKCPVCSKKYCENKFVVDHLHCKYPMPIRGIICRYCNHRVVGRHKDPELLRSAANYIENANTGHWIVKKKKKNSFSVPPRSARGLSKSMK